MPLYASSTSLWIALNQAVYDIDSFALNNGSTIVRTSYLNGRGRARSQHIAGYASNSPRYNHILTNPELRTIAVGQLRLKYHVTKLIQERARKLLELVVPVACSPVQGMLNGEIPFFCEALRSF